MTRRPVVAIVQPFVPTYRVGLFNAIDEQLQTHGLTLEVWHDQPKGIVAARGNASSGPWSVPVRQRRLSVKRRNVTYRHLHRPARNVQALVHGLASSNVETYLLARDPQVNLMLWGHGRNFTAKRNGVDDRLERFLCRNASHLFAYTEAGARHLVAAGHTADKVTVVRNSTDTSLLKRHRDGCSAQDVEDLRQRHGLSGKHVGLFVGAFDGPKDLPFLCAAADLIHARDPKFILLMAGAGPLAQMVHEFALARDYVRLLGRVEAPDLGRLSNVVDLMLMPGRVGLVAVDSLALGIPLVTTNHDFHAPEVEYLSPKTSLFLPRDVASFADGVHRLLTATDGRTRLSAASLSASESLSAESAGARFVAGILRGLDGQPSRR